MFNFLSKKKKRPAQLEKFYETVTETAFPNGSNQINEEVNLLISKLEGSWTKEAVKSLLLESTLHLYLELLETSNYTTSDMSDYLISTKNLSPENAELISRHLINKFNS